MNEAENWEYKRVMAWSFTTTEIDCLEDLASLYFERVEAGKRIDLPRELLLDAIANLEEEDGRGSE